MPPARGHTRNNDRRANEGVNVDANADGDAPPLCITPAVRVWSSDSTIRARPKPAPSRHQYCREGGEATTSAGKSRLGPDHDAWNTIAAHRQTASVDDHRNHDNRGCHHDDRGRGRRYDNDNDRYHSWSSN
jgi:hypothetical protein